MEVVTTGTGHMLSDPNLAIHAARGDARALGLLYDRHASVMLGLAVRILRRRDAAADLVHDVFVEAWRSMDGFDPRRGTFRSWMLTRLRSRAVDRLRREAREQGTPAETTPAQTETPEVRYDATRVPGWLAALPAPQREALQLAYFEGLTMNEIADRLGVPPGTVKARVSRGLARLRAERGGQS